MKNYAKRDLIEQILKRDLTEDELTALPIIMEAVDLYINNQIGSTFLNVSESTKYYDGGGKIINTDPVHSVSAVKLVDEDEIVQDTYDEGDYELRPRNETIKTWIEHRWGKFLKGTTNIAVIGKFSLSTDGTVPEDIQYAASYLVAQTFMQSFSGELKSESIEGYSRTFGKFTTEHEFIGIALDKYKRVQI